MKSQKILTYKVIIEEDWDEKRKRNVFVSYVPKLGISDFGDTVEETLQHTTEAIKCHIAGLRKIGEEIPESGSQLSIVSDINIRVSSA